jgi:TRAP-type mannitol/chloroaromatic compound transport system substrate-binding protein
MGVVPQQLAAGDIYPSLEKGTIDAAEWVGPYDDEKLGFVKVARNYYYPGWWEGCGQSHNIMNLAKWNELPKSYQSAIITASNDAWVWTLSKYDALNPQALLRLASAGAVLRPFPQPVLEDCFKTANTLYDELSKANPHFKKMYDSLVPFRTSGYAWLQVAEGTFDNFMMRQRTRT